jgi:hypothetical protein
MKQKNNFKKNHSNDGYKITLLGFCICVLTGFLACNIKGSIDPYVIISLIGFLMFLPGAVKFLWKIFKYLLHEIFYTAASGINKAKSKTN